MCFQGPQKPHLFFSNALQNLSLLYCPVSAMLHVSCSFSLLSSLMPVLARARTRQSYDADARFTRDFF